MSDKSKNTGTGGININGDLYTMDVVVPQSEEDIAGGKQGEYSPGDISVDKAVKDISKPTRETFAKYLSKTTLGQEGPSPHQNVYPVGSGDATVLQERPLKDTDGNPARPGAQNNEAKFAPEFNQGIGSDNPANIKRGLAAGSAPDGNTLLKNAATPALSGGEYIKPAPAVSETIDSYVSAVLKKNRFTSNTSFLNANYLSEGPDSSTLNKNASFVGPSQLTKGAYAGNDDNLERKYGYGRLAQIGTVLQLKAAVEPGSKESGYTPGRTAQLDALLPGAGQIGVDVANPLNPLPYELINIKTIIEQLTETAISEEQLTDFNLKFEGTINSVFDKFSGFSSSGMLLLAGALIIAVGLAMEALAAVFSVFSLFDAPGYNGIKLSAKGNGRPLLGSFNGVGPVPVGANALDLFVSTIAAGATGTTTGPAAALGFFGVQATNNLSLFSAANLGMLSYFGFIGGKTLAFPGQVVVTARAIVRSTALIILAFKDFVEISNNPAASVQQFFNIVDTIRTSRLIATLNIFAKIGDTQTLNPRNTGLDESDPQGLNYSVTINGDAGAKISEIDAADDKNTAYTFSKSRLRAQTGETRKLAWRTNRTPDLLGGPSDQTKFLSVALGSSIVPDAKLDPLARTRFDFAIDTSTQNIGRFSDDDRIAVEQEFDSEYVPFYFHDVRTNEILGFHAFLTSLTDNFSANYESTEAFGRIEPIITYKNTTRKISLSFIIAALDESDFDYMWAKINKLVTLVYPQYTSGKQVASGRSVFTKPFTQLIGASPMVRLRIGDVITGNYSKFNLAGIFGLQNENAVLNLKTRDKQQGQVIANNIAAAQTRFNGGKSPGYKWIPPQKNYILYAFTSAAQPLLAAGNPTPILPLDCEKYPIFEMEVLRQIDTFDYEVKFSIAPGADPKIVEAYKNALNPPTPTGKPVPPAKKVPKHLPSQPDVEQTTFIANIDDFRFISPDSLQKLTQVESQISEAVRAVFKNYDDEAKSFLQESNNVIARSFKSTGGRGIAGFIDNIDFDWLDSTWETDKSKSGRVAPKMCKVSMGFTPIHDIAPGLDHHGINRAPVYQVASTSPTRETATPDAKSKIKSR